MQNSIIVFKSIQKLRVKVIKDNTVSNKTMYGIKYLQITD